MKKPPILFFLFMLALQFFVRNLLLFLLGIIMCFIGIWSKDCMMLGIAALCFDLILSVVQTIQIHRQAEKESDDPEFNDFTDAMRNGPDAVLKKVEDAMQNGEVTFPDEEPDPDDHQEILQKLVVYRTLNASIHEDMTLEEMMASFQEMCKISVGDPDDLLFETGTYNFTGEKLFYFSLVRQFQFLDEDEFVQLHLDVTYLPCSKTKFLFGTKWASRTEGNFFDMVMNSRAYRVAQNLPIYKVHVRVDET